MIEINKIKEIDKGIYFVLLDYLTKDKLKQIINQEYKYIWCVDHVENPHEWRAYNYSLYSQFGISQNVKARNITMEYYMPTSDFLNLIQFVNNSLTIIQTNSEPPSYLNLRELNDKSRYRLLKSKADFLFEIQMPGAPDYTPVVSPHIDFLEKTINIVKEE